MEAKVYTDGPQKWGNKYRKRGGISIREEWIGADRFDEDAAGPGIEIYI